MTPEEIKDRVLGYKWERWLERPFHAFTLSLFEDCYTKESFESIGLFGIDSSPQLFQNGYWYFCAELMDKMDRQIEKYLEDHTVFDITSGLKSFQEKSSERIRLLIGSDESLEKRFAEVFDILTHACTYIWLAHGLESYCDRRLHDEVPKYVSGDVDKFIGDASYPKKKNANFTLDTLLRSDISDEEIAARVGWVKIRDGFSDPFTPSEIGNMRRNLKQIQAFPEVEIPAELRELFDQAQEIVFFRTERTDVFYQLYFQVRPILRELASKYGIEFRELNYYRAKGFISGRAERYLPSCCFAFDGKNVLFQDEPILIEEISTSDVEIHGTVAFRGRATGTVRLVRDLPELEKVEPGDILVTQMTFPSFIQAMQKASAFVTDEGGMTCHAAIVAREMKKPCIVGTKNATKILKDGDMVEVDAENGVVKIISNK